MQAAEQVAVSEFNSWLVSLGQRSQNIIILLLGPHMSAIGMILGIVYNFNCLSTTIRRSLAKGLGQVIGPPSGYEGHPQGCRRASGRQ